MIQQHVEKYDFIDALKEARYFVIGYLARAALSLLPLVSNKAAFLQNMFRKNLSEEMEKNPDFLQQKNELKEKINKVLSQNTALAGKLISRYLIIKGLNKEIDVLEKKKTQIVDELNGLDSILTIKNDPNIQKRIQKLYLELSDVKSALIQKEEKRKIKIFREIDDTVHLFKSNKELLTGQVNLYFNFLEPTFTKYGHYLLLDEFKKFQEAQKSQKPYNFPENLKTMTPFLNEESLKELYKTLNKKEFMKDKDAEGFLKAISLAPNSEKALSLKDTFAQLKTISVSGLDFLYRHLEEQPIINSSDRQLNQENIINQFLNFNNQKMKVDVIIQEKLADYQKDISQYIDQQKTRQDRKTDLSSFDDIQNNKIRTYSQLFKILIEDQRVNGKNEILQGLIKKMRTDVNHQVEAAETIPRGQFESPINFQVMIDFFQKMMKNPDMSNALKELATSTELKKSISYFQEKSGDLPKPVHAAKAIFAHLDVSKLLENVSTALKRQSQLEIEGSVGQNHLKNALNHFLLTSGKHQGALILLAGTAVRNETLSDGFMNEIGSALKINKFAVDFGGLRVGVDAAVTQAISAEKGRDVFFKRNIDTSFLQKYAQDKIVQGAEELKTAVTDLAQNVTSNVTNLLVTGYGVATSYISSFFQKPKEEARVNPEKTDKDSFRHQEQLQSVEEIKVEELNTRDSFSELRKKDPLYPPSLASVVTEEKKIKETPKNPGHG